MEQKSKKKGKYKEMETRKKDITTQNSGKNFNLEKKDSFVSLSF